MLIKDTRVRWTPDLHLSFVHAVERLGGQETYPVGLESRVLEVKSLLDVGSNEVVYMVGIHGRNGIGKTTLAATVYNSIAYQFEGFCFLKDMRENSYKLGLKHLQSILLSELVQEKNINIASVEQGISIIQHRLQKKKVLLILDGVDKLEQLQALAGRPEWFGPGSRVIITTRDIQLLSRHEVIRTYEVKELDENDALQLLSCHAFKTENFDTSHAEVLNRVVTYASGLPLTLKKIGSYLYGKSIEQWESVIERYTRIPREKILEKSFDALGNEEKSHVGLESCSDAFSYDVFLSFRSTDTLHGFTGYLYKALHDSGIHSFIDDEELQRGEEITPAIVKAIEESRIAITVLSINYASSSFCLDELATILACLKRKRLLVLPVFYNVDPSQLQLQKGIYGEALEKHEERLKHNMEKLEKWKLALHEVANLPGFHVEHGAAYEYQFGDG